MNREIILVQVIDGDELMPYKSKAFTDWDDAEQYFKDILKEHFKENTALYTDEDFEDIIEDGYFDDGGHLSITINLITLCDKED